MGDLEHRNRNASEPSSTPNVSSPFDHQPNTESLTVTHGKVEAESQQCSLASAKLQHLEDSSDRFVLAGGHSLKPQSSANMSPTVAGCCNDTEERASGVLSVEKEALSIGDSELIELQKDETPNDYLGKTQSVLPDAKPGEAIQESTKNSPDRPLAQTSDNSNWHAVEQDAPFASVDPDCNKFPEDSKDLESVPSVESKIVNQEDINPSVESRLVNQEAISASEGVDSLGRPDSRNDAAPVPSNTTTDATSQEAINASQEVDSLGSMHSSNDAAFVPSNTTNDAALVPPPSVTTNDPSNTANFLDDGTFVFSPSVEGRDPSSGTSNLLPEVSRVAVGTQPSVDGPKNTENVARKRFQIDTTAPFESVKHAVSKFGGILDWKAHRAQTMERRQIIEQELERAHYEIPTYKKMCEAAEDARKEILKELNSTKRLIEEMKLHLEKVQTEELQAKQDAELAKLRVEEMEQGIAGESSVAAKAQLEVAKARYAAATSELKTVKDELEVLQNDYALLVTERDAAVIKAQEAVCTSKKVEKEVEDLTIELLTVKETLECAHAAHLEAEDNRIAAAMEREQEGLKWEKEAHQAEEEAERLNQKLILSKNLKSNWDAASESLKDLKAELATYMQSKPKQDNCEDGNFNEAPAEPENRTHNFIQASIASARRELEEGEMNFEKARAEVDCLKVVAASLKSEIEKETDELDKVRKKEGTASVAVASLEAELDQIKSKIAVVQMEEKAAREKMEALRKQLQEAAEEAEQAKSIAQMTREELWKAEEEAEQAKAGENTMECRLLAAQKEIEAAKASEKLALAAIRALQESESAQSIKDEDSPTGVTLSLEQYYELSKQAHDAEEEANSRVAAAMSQIEVAKECELRNLTKLEELIHEIDRGRAALQVAMEKAEKAKEEKLGVEQELRQWRAEHEHRRKAVESIPEIQVSKSPRTSFEENKETKDSVSAPDDAVLSQRLSSDAHLSGTDKDNKEREPSNEVVVPKKKKKSFFPRFLLFFARKRSQAKSV